jgi:hypothetical protein
MKSEYIDLTKKLVGKLKLKGIDINSIKVEINGNESRNDYSVKVTYNL